ncbi:hypothetical protein [uncultured Desulfovibrio sp.]|uniref:Uncharacterized protein n=1 Tax=Candidatus Desulfovibrio intestinavium TaxID=2838534 RepID=A0A9D2HQ21_9BACT|nr:hypothetical protein [uncultured Desulfovibrio sp.]HJA79819.1 hypothetical protein [Candidatus Desulfovibrio intestinavium]
MSLFSWLQNLVTPPLDDDPESDASYEWDQNARIILAIIVMVIAAIIMYWILR